MEVATSDVGGVLLIKLGIWEDACAYFVETWQRHRYEEASICMPFVRIITRVSPVE